MYRKSGLQSMFLRDGAPIAMVWAALCVLSAIVMFFVPNLIRSVAFITSDFSHIYTAATYWLAAGSLANFGIIILLFIVMMIVQFGGGLERDLGRNKFLGFVAYAILAPAICWQIGGSILGAVVPLIGMNLPLSVIVVAWCTRYSTTMLTVYVFPVEGKWIGVLTAILVFVNSFTIHPVFGIVSELPLVGAFLFASNRIPGLSYGFSVRRPRTPKVSKGRADDSYFDTVRDREKDRLEKEKLRKLFENSMKDDK